MIRWELLANPVNWVIVILMLFIASLAFTVALRYQGS
jgi:hypothetical protein